MSKIPEKPTGKKPATSASKKGGNKQRDMIVRVAVYGVLVVVLILALIDYFAKKKATDTVTAWREAKKSADAVVEEKDLKEMKESELESLVVGNPSKETITVSGREQARTRSKEKVIYDWGGIFRSYKATVYIGPGSHRPVEEIFGPGEKLEDVE